MNLDYTAADESFRAEVRSFLERGLPAELRRKMIERRHLSKDDIVVWQRTLNAQRWAVPAWPVEHGGQPWTPTQRYIFQEEMALAHAPEPLPFNVNMIGPVLARLGSPKQQARFLSATANLDIWWCQGFSEPGAGSDLAALKTSAVRDGDDYVLNGQKIWTTQAQHADWMFALVRTDASGRKQQGITFLLIDMRTPGITIRPIHSIDGIADLHEVFFDDVRVPITNRVGEEGEGWSYAKQLLGHERSGIARVGLSKERLLNLRALEAEMTADGRLSPAEAARLRSKLAEVEIRLRALELTQLRVVEADARGGGAHGAASILKIAGTELQQRLTELTMELAGPAGLAMPGHGHDDGGWVEAAAPFYFTMRKVSIFGGSNEVQKNIVASSVLGL